MLLKVVQLKKENLLQWVFFFLEYVGRRGERAKGRADTPKTKLPKVNLNYVSARVMVTLDLVLQVLPEQQIDKIQCLC